MVSEFEWFFREILDRGNSIFSRSRRSYAQLSRQEICGLYLYQPVETLQTRPFIVEVSQAKIYSSFFICCQFWFSCRFRRIWHHLKELATRFQVVPNSLGMASNRARYGVIVKIKSDDKSKMNCTYICRVHASDPIQESQVDPSLVINTWSFYATSFMNVR